MTEQLLARRTVRGTVVGLALTAGLVLSGCGSAPDLDPASADQLQQGVLVVSQTVAAGQYDAADAAVAQLREDLEAAVDAGDVSASRYGRIDAALVGVSAEVAAAREAAAAQQAAAEQAAAEQAAAEQAAADQAAADRAAQDEDGKSNGRGSGKDDD